MATRFGDILLRWLKARGWKEDPLEDEVYGDPQVIDNDGKVYSIYDALRIHEQRTGERHDLY